MASFDNEYTSRVPALPPSSSRKLFAWQPFPCPVDYSDGRGARNDIHIYILEHLPSEVGESSASDMLGGVSSLHLDFTVARRPSRPNPAQWLRERSVGAKVLLFDTSSIQ